LVPSTAFAAAQEDLSKVEGYAVLDRANPSASKIEGYAVLDGNPTPPGQIKHVQGCVTQNGASSSSTVVCNMAPVGGGNTIVLWIGSNTTVTGVNSVTDDKGDTCTVLDEAGGVGAYNLTSAYCVGVTAGAKTFTATLSSAATLALIFGDEYSSLAALVLDKHVAQTQTTPGTGTDAISSGSQTPLADGELIVAGTVNKLGSAGTGTITWGTGYLSEQNVNNVLRSEFKIQTTAASIGGTFTASSAIDSFDTAMMTFTPNMNAPKLEGYAVLDLTEPGLSKLEGYAVLCNSPGAGTCPSMTGSFGFVPTGVGWQ